MSESPNTGSSDERGPAVAAADIDFEQTIDELEEIVRKLDREDVGLDESITLFTQGMERLKAAHTWLDDASGRVEELIESASGKLEMRPFEDEEA
ncbi:MAG: exodeoxyribonuclease VII small subunit [Gemmatimonadota bacterium]|nr:exodeoxyribonuclease VII small subunit [Gemmatimonadota bacterium]